MHWVYMARFWKQGNCRSGLCGKRPGPAHHSTELTTSAKLMASLRKHILKRPKFSHSSVRSEESKCKIQRCEYQGQRRRRRRWSRHRSRDSPTACGRDHSAANILLQLVERTTSEQISTLQPGEDAMLVEVYPEGLQPVEMTHRGKV